MKEYSYLGLSPKQSTGKRIVCFAAPVDELLEFCAIDRIGRTSDGSLFGFQRSKVIGHIQEIRDYLSEAGAILPNSVVVAFTSGVSLNHSGGNLYDVKILVDGEKPGVVVDGQQRLSALQLLPDKVFEVLVSCVICESEEELRRQFILINNTKPLPKSLIYELLPRVNNLPTRMAKRAQAGKIIEWLNFDKNSSLAGQIKMHTHPTGAIRDTVLQRMLLNSLSDGILRDLCINEDEIASAKHLSSFFQAVQDVFESDWVGHTSSTSRLVHGAGIIALGYLFEEIWLAQHSSQMTTDVYARCLELIKPNCAWSSGTWQFGPEGARKWNDLQVIPKDYMLLSNYLVAIFRKRYAAVQSNTAQVEQHPTHEQALNSHLSKSSDGFKHCP